MSVLQLVLRPLLLELVRTNLMDCSGDIPDKDYDALRNCQGYDRLAFVPQASELVDIAKVADTLMGSTESVWISSSNANTCAVLFADGSTADNSTDTSIDCNAYRRPLCGAYIRESIIGR